MLLVTPSRLLGEGLTRVLTASGITVKGYHHDLDGLYAALNCREAAVMLLDDNLLRMPVEAQIHAIRATFPHIRILVLANTLTDEAKCQLVQAGASGCFPASHPTTQSFAHLVMAIHEIANGGIWVERRILAEVIRNIAWVSLSIDTTIKGLTVREKEIARLFGGEVLCNKEIAERLHVSEKTVKQHLSNIYRKLQITSRTQLALLLQRHTQPRRD